MKINGNELGWILRLAEGHYDSEQFQQWLKKHDLEKLNDFLKELMCKFHPTNFYAGNSRKVWILTDEEEKRKQ